MKKILGIILRITFFLPILLQVSFCIFQLLLCSRLKCMFKVIFAKLMHFSFKLWPVRVEKNFKCFFTYRNLAKLLEWSLRAVSMDFSGIFSASVTLLASAAEESIDTVVSETAKDAAEDTIPTPPLKEVVGDVAALALVVPAMSALTTSVLENSPGVSGYFAGFLVIGSIFTALALASPVVGFSAIVGTTTTVALKVFGLTSAATALKAGVAASTVTMLACRFGEALPAETDIPRESASLDSIIQRHALERNQKEIEDRLAIAEANRAAITALAREAITAIPVAAIHAKRTPAKADVEALEDCGAVEQAEAHMLYNPAFDEALEVLQDEYTALQISGNFSEAEIKEAYETELVALYCYHRNYALITESMAKSSLANRRDREEEDTNDSEEF